MFIQVDCPDYDLDDLNLPYKSLAQLILNTSPSILKVRINHKLWLQVVMDEFRNQPVARVVDQTSSTCIKLLYNRMDHFIGLRVRLPSMD